MIWEDHDGMHRFKRPFLLSALLIAGAVAVLAFLAYRRRRVLHGPLIRQAAPPLFARLGRPRLSLIMSLLFIGLSIPILIFILIYNYNKNSAGMVSILNDAVAQTSQAGVERTEN